MALPSTVELRVLRVESDEGLVCVGRGDGVVGLAAVMRCGLSDAAVAGVVTRCGREVRL